MTPASLHHRLLHNEKEHLHRYGILCDSRGPAYLLVVAWEGTRGVLDSPSTVANLQNHRESIQAACDSVHSLHDDVASPTKLLQRRGKLEELKRVDDMLPQQRYRGLDSVLTALQLFEGGGIVAIPGGWRPQESEGSSGRFWLLCLATRMTWERLHWPPGLGGGPSRKARRGGPTRAPSPSERGSPRCAPPISSFLFLPPPNPSLFLPLTPTSPSHAHTSSLTHPFSFPCSIGSSPSFFTPSTFRHLGHQQRFGAVFGKIPVGHRPHAQNHLQHASSSFFFWHLAPSSPPKQECLTTWTPRPTARAATRPTAASPSLPAAVTTSEHPPTFPLDSFVRY